MFCSFSPLQAERHTSACERLALCSHLVLVRARRHRAGRLGHCNALALTWCLSTHSCVQHSFARMRLNNAGDGSSQIPHNWLSHIKAQPGMLHEKGGTKLGEGGKKSRLHWMQSFWLICVSVGCVFQTLWDACGKETLKLVLTALFCEIQKKKYKIDGAIHSHSMSV